MSKREFKAGDRVAVYHDGFRLTGTVKFEVDCEGSPLTIDTEDALIGAHPKQCRLLKPRAKPRAIDSCR